jgi:hypothetical protein
MWRSVTCPNENGTALSSGSKSHLNPRKAPDTRRDSQPLWAASEPDTGTVRKRTCQRMGTATAPGRPRRLQYLVCSSVTRAGSTPGGALRADWAAQGGAGTAENNATE